MFDLGVVWLVWFGLCCCLFVVWEFGYLDLLVLRFVAWFIAYLLGCFDARIRTFDWFVLIWFLVAWLAYLECC